MEGEKKGERLKEHALSMQGAAARKGVENSFHAIEVLVSLNHNPF